MIILFFYHIQINKDFIILLIRPLLYCFLHKLKFMSKQNQQREGLKQQLQSVALDHKQKGKKKLINKKNLVSLLNFSFIFQISDSLFRAIKNSNVQEFQNISKTAESFYSKTLRSVTFQKNNTVLKFRTVKQNIQSIENYIEQFKSLGDNYLYDMAVSYQFMYNQYNIYSKFQSQNSLNITHHQVIEDLLTKVKGKKYLVYLYQTIQDQACLSKIVISNQLLQATGYAKQELQLDFLKYKHVFFQIVDKEFFRKIYKELGNLVKKNIQNNIEITANSQNNPHKKNLVVFNDFVYRKKLVENKEQVDQKLNAVIQFYKPHPKITVFEFQIDERHVLSTVSRQKVTSQKQKFSQMIEKQQQKSLEHILDKMVDTQQSQ